MGLGNIDFWDYIERIANLAGLIALIPLGFLVKRMQQQWRFNRIKKNPCENVSEDNTGVLIISIREEDVSKKVMDYMRGAYPQIKLDKDHLFYPPLGEMFKLKMIPSDVEKFRKELKKLRISLIDANIQHIHLFIAGPLILPLLIGDEFANNLLITFHNLNIDTHMYECWGDI